MRIRIRKVLAGAALASAAIFFFCFGRHMEGYRGLDPGDLVPRSELVSVEGSPVPLEWWRGSTTLLVLFSPTCPHCRAEIRQLERVAAELTDLRVVLLSIDGSAPAFETPFPIYRDPTGEFLRRTRRVLVPTLYCINGAGKVVYARIGQGSTTSDLEIFKSILLQPATAGEAP
jgi:thiol-disulfide isomerase/thioredoxin